MGGLEIKIYVSFLLCKIYALVFGGNEMNINTIFGNFTYTISAILQQGFLATFDFLLGGLICLGILVHYVRKFIGKK